MADEEESSWLYYVIPLAVFTIFWFTCGDSVFGKREERRPPREEPPKKVDPKDYIYLTKEELSEYDGAKRPDKKAYLAIKHDIFDVSGSEFYLPGGPYAVFTGKECSVWMAKNSTDQKDAEADYRTTKLSSSYQDSLDQWHDFFTNKYSKIGEVVDNKKDN